MEDRKIELGKLKKFIELEVLDLINRKIKLEVIEEESFFILIFRGTCLGDMTGFRLHIGKDYYNYDENDILYSICNEVIYNITKFIFNERFKKISNKGEVQLVNSKDKIIANMFSQFNYGYDKKQYTNYLALATGLNKILKFASQRGLTIAIPYKIGCVRGGADWNVVLKIIENIFMDYDITIYKLNKF